MGDADDASSSRQPGDADEPTPAAPAPGDTTPKPARRSKRRTRPAPAPAADASGDAAPERPAAASEPTAAPDEPVDPVDEPSDEPAVPADEPAVPDDEAPSDEPAVPADEVPADEAPADEPAVPDDEAPPDEPAAPVDEAPAADDAAAADDGPPPVDGTPGGTPLPPPPPADAETDPSGPVDGVSPPAREDGPVTKALGWRPRWPAHEPGRSRAVAGVAAGAVALVALVAALATGGNDFDGTSGAPPTDAGDAPAAATDPPAQPTTVTSPPPTEPPATEAPATQPPATDPPPPTEPPPTEPPPTEPPATTPPPTPSPATAAPTTVAGAVPTTTAGAPGATTTTLPGPATLVGRLVPDIAAFPETLDEIAQATQIATLAAEPRRDVASPGPIGSLCAVVRLEVQAQLAGRWERDGDEVASTDLTTVGVPGFGDCLVGDDGGPLGEGVYQFVVADENDNDSAAGTFVVGAVPLDQTFVNSSAGPICTLRIGPSDARFYDAYDFRGEPLAPGAAVVVPIADVDQDVRVDGCEAGADPIAEFDFNPAAGVPQPLTPS